MADMMSLSLTRYFRDCLHTSDLHNNYIKTMLSKYARSTHCFDVVYLTKGKASTCDEKLELYSHYRALYAPSCWDIGHAVTLTFDLLIPNIEEYILVPKCTNAESLVKFGPVIFKISC